MMKNINYLKAAALGGASALVLGANAYAMEYNIPGGDLKSALDAYAAQTHISLIVSGAAVKDVHTAGAKGELTADAALSRILTGTGFVSYRNAQGEIGILPGQRAREATPRPVLEMADAAPARAASSVETVVVTSSKIKGDIQTVPIAITALSQEQLTSRQIAGGPDLVKEVPNLTFSKTNFSGYTIQIRGIGTQAISVATDPAVAVALNDIPFIRNHFFEQEFYDVGQVEVLRGPQGTLYGRNATAGVVNVVTAKPTDQFEAMASADWGNYSNRRYEGMVNIPIVDDRLDLRVAGEWTKRDGYTYDSPLHSQVDGRDLWSSRVSLRWRPTSKIDANLVWEHFQEDDDRLRSGKALCATDPGPSSVDGPAGLVTNLNWASGGWLSQGCKPASLYSPLSAEEPNYMAIPFIGYAETLNPQLYPGFDPFYPQQSLSYRTIASDLQPRYTAKNDTAEFNVDYQVSPALTLTSQTGYNEDHLYSTEDYLRFDTVPGVFESSQATDSNGVYCDPQFGCTNRLVGEDVSQEHAEQFYQELRLASSFQGPLNFSVGGSYLHYSTLEDYFVFFNAISDLQEVFNVTRENGYHGPVNPFPGNIINECNPPPAWPGETFPTGIFGLGCGYIDPNPLASIDGQGHNYFRSENPYRLHSWAGFGEVNYQISPDLKLTGGLRWTDDVKSFDVIPSWTLLQDKGYPVTGTINQQWKEWTGRFVASWTPKLDFTDQTLVYGSYARGYKGGGANPPGVFQVIIEGVSITSTGTATHPATFKPEFNDAFELGTKNTLLDGALTLNGDVFYYKYQNYQISEIVDRTALNQNFNATVRGAELESTWEPIPGLRFNFTGGYENATLDKGDKAIDLMDRTAGQPGWMVVKPFLTQTSNCILPTYVVNQMISGWRAQYGGNNSTPTPDPSSNGALDVGPLSQSCFWAYNLGQDPGANFGIPTGFDPLAGTPGDPNTGQDVYNGVDYAPPNNGQGFYKKLGGNQLPNAPHFTTSLSADYTMPVSEDWAATLHGDFYWQSQSWWRVFNDKTYDKLRGYSNVNLALILTSANGWQVMGYVKNIFDTTAITGAFLNSDDSALTTNVFLTDPRLYGVRITKNF
jgi:iron complex outermembrane receptor protein